MSKRNLKSKRFSTGDWIVDLIAILALVGLFYELISLGMKVFFGQG